ncbi:hypothetical protein PILCRDRAFT_13088 [Piloderma croceum F 1598]|uniref:HAM1-like N-terminal domain-containing protein n=1 Tax=Piloderma croceum (strain F 1598) TaxID=765440 RepID=A0A0C3F7Z7_PILCF|nr:hypothetical protein PILCRDRAFT_13088 [Piloderma croceum F 1598]
MRMGGSERASNPFRGAEALAEIYECERQHQLITSGRLSGNNKASVPEARIFGTSHSFIQHPKNDRCTAAVKTEGGKQRYEVGESKTAKADKPNGPAQDQANDLGGQHSKCGTTMRILRRESLSFGSTKINTGLGKAIASNNSLQTATSKLRALLKLFANGRSMNIMFEAANTLIKDANEDDAPRNWFKDIFG